MVGPTVRAAMTALRNDSLLQAHMPRFLLAAILSRMRSPMTSRSNWANDSRMLSVSLPIYVRHS
jgi:hypothetical protein